MQTRRIQGFTLMEMVVVIVLLAILAPIAALLVDGGVRAYVSSRTQSTSQGQGRLALERMTRDLRSIRSATPADLTMAPATQITYTDLGGTAVTYTRSGTTLTRNGVPLADNISALNFAYLRRDGKTTAASASEVYYITTTLSITQGGATLNSRATVRPRNFP